MCVTLPSNGVFQFPSAFLRQGKANPVNRSFQASWFSTRIWLHHYETYKISSASKVKIVPSAFESSLGTSGNIKFSRWRSPEPPLREGDYPLSCSPPTRAFGTCTLMFHGQTTFQKLTTGLDSVGTLNREVWWSNFTKGK